MLVISACMSSISIMANSISDINQGIHSIYLHSYKNDEPEDPDKDGNRAPSRPLVCTKSLYTSLDYNELKVPDSFHKKLERWHIGIKDSTSFGISIPTNIRKKTKYSENGSRGFKGSRCSANMSNMVILPDGKVTICEQLYWNPSFIVGDITKNKIQQIWNSPRSLEIYTWAKDNVSKESPCSACKLYEDCLSYGNRCFVNILKEYGTQNWDYPDPRCAFAPDTFS